MPRLLAFALALALFTGYTLLVVVNHGPLGFISDHLLGGWHLQIFIDLVLAVISFLVLAVPDAKRHGISPWPYLVASIVAGSIGVLSYLVHRELVRIRRPELRG